MLIKRIILNNGNLEPLKLLPIGLVPLGLCLQVAGDLGLADLVAAVGEEDEAAGEAAEGEDREAEEAGEGEGLGNG